MFDKTRHQMNYWRWDSPHAFGDQADHSNPQTPSAGKVKCTGERFSWYGSDDLREKIEPPSCRQYKPGDFRAIRPLNWDEIMDEDFEDQYRVHPGVPSGGRSCPSVGNDNDNGEGEEDAQCGEKGTRKVKGTKDGKGQGKAKGKGKGKGNGKGKCIVNHTPGGDDITRTIALQLEKEMYEADSDTKRYLERVSFKPEVSPAVSISSDDDTDSSKSDSKYASEHDPDVLMHVEDNVDALDGDDFDGDVDMEMTSDHEKEEDKEEEDNEEEDKEEEADEDEEEDKDEDDGKEPRTIGHGEMVNTSADNVDTMVEDQPIGLPQQGKERHKHTPWLQPLAPAPRAQTLEPHPQLRTPETHPPSGQGHMGLVRPHKPRPAVPTLRDAEVTRKSLDVDMDQQLLGESAGGDSVLYVPVPDDPLPNASLPEVRLDGSMGEEWASPRVAEQAVVVVFRLGSGCCLVRFLGCNLFISGIDNYTRCEDFSSLRVYFICGFWIGFVVFIVLWDIAHVAFLQLLACKEPPCDGVEAQYISQVSWKYCELTHQAAQAQDQCSYLSTVYTPLLACHGQCQRTPLSVALNFHAERSPPQTAGDLNTSNYTILNTFKLCAKRI